MFAVYVFALYLLLQSQTEARKYDGYGTNVKQPNWCPQGTELLTMRGLGYVYCIPSDAKHRPAIVSMQGGRVFEPQTHTAIRQLYKPGTGIIHCGTFFGDFLPDLCSLVETSNGHVYAFEPNIASHAAAEATVMNNHCLKSVTVLRHSLGEKIEEQKLCFERMIKGKLVKNGGASQVHNKNQTIDDQNCHGVTTVPMDMFVPWRTHIISVVHLDVEKMELFALRGGENLIATHRPAIIVETNEPDFLRAHSYEFVKKAERNKVWCPKEKMNWCKSVLH